MSSFYIEHTAKDKDKFKQINKTSGHQDETKNIQNRINKNNQSTSMLKNIRTMVEYELKKRRRR